ncbi:hypothetical protein BV20DRAFT_1039580 [Pilatotrama ljubarskyi]|nr:hypothetical protein BV20DRAFT_1039580 [Pilatotrama ljubarskyi]
MDAAPVRVRRAATLADLLQHQVLVRGAVLRDNAGARLSDVEWLLKPTVAKPFARKMGLAAQVIEHTYKLVAERVPVHFNPQDPAVLRAVEKAHHLQPHAIVRAEWIKPVEHRFAGQCTAFVMLTITGVEQANLALKGLTLAGRKVLVRRDLNEPKRCACCQSYDGHFARECKARGDVCANCTGPHPSAQCDSAGNPKAYHCSNCDASGHAAWDHACPTLRAKVRARTFRKADTGSRFFVTNTPETWVSEEEELARAPPPPSVWSQVRHHFRQADHCSQPSQQSRLDTYFGEHAQTSVRQRL